MSAQTQVPDVVRAYFDCANREDWDGLAQLWTDDAELVAFGSRGMRVRRGKAEVLRYYDGLFDTWSAHFDDVTRVIACGDTATVEITFRGATLDGRPVTFDIVDLFDLADGRIRRLAIWHDVVAARAALSA